MDTVRQLVDAMESGDSVNIINSFNQAMSEKIAGKLDEYRFNVAKNMFTSVEESVETQDDQEEIDEQTNTPAKVHPNALHVQHVGGGKYKVHAVGKNFADGIKTGEHLSDTDLDDFHEMGGKVKHVK